MYELLCHTGAEIYTMPTPFLEI